MNPINEDFRALGGLGESLHKIRSGLQSGGPELSFELLVGYIDGVLDPVVMQQVGRHIVTWRVWYDAYWETVGALDFQDPVRRDGNSLEISKELFSRVQKLLVEVLGVDDDEVSMDATLEDLGAESIDYLEIVLQLEKVFDIKISRAELFPDKITDNGLEELRQTMPHADIDKFSQHPSVERIAELFTVRMICNFIAARLAG